jgi:hypothetical protein
MARKRALRPFVFGSGKRKRRRSGRKASGVAARAKNAPAHCKKGLSVCMTGGGGRSKASGCMRGYWRCIKGG